MKWFALPRSVGLAGMLAGTALLGGGLGTAAIATLPAAGAATAQLPAAAVREQNVNAAGRIRVALPSTGVGVNGNVSVSNLPTNSAGRLKTQNGTGQAQLAQAWAVTINDGGITPANVSGSGVFKGLVLTAYQDGNAGCAGAFVTIDGQQMLGEAIGGGANFGVTNPIEGASNPNGAGNNFLYFTPPGGLPFHKSLNVNLKSFCPGQTQPIAYRIWYTTK
ncbi:MAG: hypothetical protein ACYCS7_06990 [Acidimicrobiales bacterium]